MIKKAPMTLAACSLGGSIKTTVTTKTQIIAKTETKLLHLPRFQGPIFSCFPWYLAQIRVAMGSPYEI